MNYLILNPNHTPDDSSIWLAAIRRGWKTVRGQHNPESYRASYTPDDRLVYYGNMMNCERLRGVLDLNAKKLDPYWVLDVDQADVFGRRVQVMTYELAEEVGGDGVLFFKCPHEKWFKPFVGRSDQIPAGVIQHTDLVYAQEVMYFLDEVRLWVLDGKIVSWSYYIKNRQPWLEGPSDDTTFPIEWTHLVSLVMKTSKLPKSVVIDVGRTEGLKPREWFIIEANEPWASGIYHSDSVSCLDVIIDNQASESWVAKSI